MAEHGWDRDEAPGWDAIDVAIRPLVGETEPRQWATWDRPLPDQNGLWGISAYRRSDHWFLVTYGLSELFAKVSDDPNVSGWGEELTMRVHDSEGDNAPEWAAGLLARLGQLVFQRSTPYAAGTRLEFKDGGPNTPPAVCFAADPKLPSPFNTPHGRLEFVTTVGINRNVLEAMRDKSTAEVLEDLRSGNPLLVSRGPGLSW